MPTGAGPTVGGYQPVAVFRVSQLVKLCHTVEVFFEARASVGLMPPGWP